MARSGWSGWTRCATRSKRDWMTTEPKEPTRPERLSRELGFTAAGDRDDLRRAGALPARSGRGRPGEDEPGHRDARHVPPTARAGADPADRARVPERRRAGRRARHPPAGRDDVADGGARH